MFSALAKFTLPTPKQTITMTLQNGVDAPDFTLKTKTPDGLEDVCLSEHKGQQNVVLLFFPFAFTGVCTEEACSVRDDLSAYDDLDAKEKVN